MKKIFIGLVVMLSSLLVGCMTDEDTAKSIEKDMKSKASMLKENTFKLSFDEKDISGTCKTHIVLKKEGKVVLDEKEKCLMAFNIRYENSFFDGYLLNLNVDFSKKNLSGKTYGWFNVYTITQNIKTYKSDDNQNQIEVPSITQNGSMNNFEIKNGNKIVIERDGLVLETTISY